jgi:hypothetical protein
MRACKCVAVSGDASRSRLLGCSIYDAQRPEALAKAIKAIEVPSAKFRMIPFGENGSAQFRLDAAAPILSRSGIGSTPQERDRSWFLLS